MTKSIYFVIIILFTVLGCDDKPKLEYTTNDVLAVYPNPARYHAEVTVRVLNSGYRLKVINAKGKTILDSIVDPPQDQFDLHIQDQPEGKYHVILYGNDQTIIRQFVKDE
jgi:hypothetical protein